jgi:spore maturation protein CgeB
MNILIVDVVYDKFLQDISFNKTKNDDLSFKELEDLFYNYSFGTNNIYSSILEKMGITCREVIINSERLQFSWLKDHHGIKGYTLKNFIRGRILNNLISVTNWQEDILLQQIDFYKPDIVYFQDPYMANSSLVKKLKDKKCKIVGQIASPLPGIDILCEFDLILSSLPNLVAQIRDYGIKSEFLPIGFDTRLIGKFEQVSRDIPISFVGGISPRHPTTIPMLEAAYEVNNNIHIYGYGREFIPTSSPIYNRHFGNAWGNEMFKILSRSQVTLNRHIDVSQQFANNMRLFEATGMGALLLTDFKINISQYFVVGEEIMVYNNVVDLQNILKDLFVNEFELSAKAKLGQKRTLIDHNYENIMIKLIDYLEKLF